jgi:hypothetical protein
MKTTTKEFFPEVSKIAYEGPRSKNPLAFKYYNPDELVDGKSMKQHLRFSVTYWHTIRGQLADMFGVGTAVRPWEDGTNSMKMAETRVGAYPGGKRFAFSIVDDTDCGTVSSLEPVYALLRELGMRTTKTVWARRSSMPDQFDVNSETLEVPRYLDFVRSLRDDGFELAMHTAAPGSSLRAETIAAYDRFSDLFGADPVMNVNHSMNRENLYWGRHRLDGRLARLLYDRTAGRHRFEGHVEHSPFFWGDVCRARTITSISCISLPRRRSTPAASWA